MTADANAAAKAPRPCGRRRPSYSDFLVNEVDPQGHVCHLTSLEVPKNEDEAGPSEEERAQARAALLELVGSETLERMEALAASPARQPAAAVDVTVPPPPPPPPPPRPHELCPRTLLKRSRSRAW